MRTKAEAQAKLQQMLVAEGINEPDYLERILKPATTFNMVADQWEAKRLPELSASSQHTIPFRLRKFIRPFFGNMSVDAIRTAQVNDFVRSLTAQGLKPKTVHNTYKDFRSIVNWHRQEHDQPRVCWYTKLPRLSNEPPRWFTPEEVDQIVNAADGQYKVFFRLAGYSGMRCSELAGLRYEDINWERGIIQVRRSATYGIESQTKTPAGTRTIYIDAVTLHMIRDHLGGRRTGLVFQTKLGTHLKATDINRYALKPLCAKIGIPKGTTHSFRHGRISLMVASRLPDKFIQSQVGQVDKKITNHYTHFSDEQNREMVSQLLRCGQNGNLWSNMN
jgi:integrase